MADAGRDGSWDVAVVGAGPAGSAAALAAAQARPGARVLLLDKADFPRDKPCGDGIAPHALDVLAGLGVPDAAAGYPPVGRLELGFPGGPVAAGDMARPARVVPRRVFDARLVAAAQERGAVLRRQQVREVAVLADRVLLDPGTPEQVAARVVVAADGAHSLLRRAVGMPAPRRVAFAVRGYAPAPAGAAAQVIAFGTARWPSYAWSFPIGDGWANVGYGEPLVDGAALSRRRLVEGVEELLPGAGGGARDWRGHHLPLSTGRARQPDGRVLLVGDAASLINPVTGEGIYYAVLSGSLAGRAAAMAEEPGGTYRRLLRSHLGAHLRSTDAAAALSRSPRLLGAAVRGAAADARVFADLVELGLGRGVLTPRALAGVLRGAGPLAAGAPTAGPLAARRTARRAPL
ncbi:geranylgeranyl reductase family protein [Kineococcus xinjiangensis]|uniref:Geranylgeranyl reductase family protein n=1 Tax=Kineococcus xinjiangensis TaxID=512762 RepID=A0A2S6IHR1_9ACTN|nr:NAD(P)/FAD-dependent oxidoreductase [Kineococcus xinjiangensis]PPK93754.1 geranylgeranyl reductase family protein [Kineococcus xinjiangensis]